MSDEQLHHNWYTRHNRRIRACWKACEPYSTEALERAGPEGLLPTAEWLEGQIRAFYESETEIKEAFGEIAHALALRLYGNMTQRPME